MNQRTSKRETPPQTVPAGEDAVMQAAAVLSAGGLVAFPTETVYGLGADATSGEAVARIYEAKGRPSFNPLIAHVAGLQQARRLGNFSADALALAEAFWPGPLTLVVTASDDCTVSQLARAGLDSVAIRVPGHALARRILEKFGRPVAAPSANTSGQVSPTRAEHVAADLGGRIDLIVDGGACDVGLESTIVDCTTDRPRLLRPGGVALEDIERVLGKPLERAPAEAVLAPGMLPSHYAPRALLRLDALEVQPGEAVLDFGGQLAAAKPTAPAYLDLSPAGDLREAAARLFAHLHSLDDAGAVRVAVAPIPAAGLGEAINDRLSRAAFRTPSNKS